LHLQILRCLFLIT